MPPHLRVLRLGRHPAALGRLDAHHVVQHRIHRHAGQDVEALGQAIESVHELRKGLPIPGQRRLHRTQRDRLGAHHREHRALAVVRLDRREAEAAVADYHRGDPVPSRNGQVRIPENLGVVMGVQVDKTRRDDQPAGVDYFGALMRVDPSNPGDSPVLDADIAAKARRAGTVNHHPVRDHQIEFRHRRVSCPFNVIAAHRFSRCAAT